MAQLRFPLALMAANETQALGDRPLVYERASARQLRDRSFLSSAERPSAKPFGTIGMPSACLFLRLELIATGPVEHNEEISNVSAFRTWAGAISRAVHSGGTEWPPRLNETISTAKKPDFSGLPADLIGRGERIRTSDPSVPNRVLHRTENRALRSLVHSYPLPQCASIPGDTRFGNSPGNLCLEFSRPLERLHQVAPRFAGNGDTVGFERQRMAVNPRRNPQSATADHDCCGLGGGCSIR
jgi:hypothetical protein